MTSSIQPRTLAMCELSRANLSSITLAKGVMKTDDLKNSKKMKLTPRQKETASQLTPFPLTAHHPHPQGSCREI